MRDLCGQVFSRWTVESYAGKRGKVPYWTCRCVCGVVKDICGWNLTRGLTTSCGCYHREVLFNDLSGCRFGRLTVLEYAGKHKNGTHSTWLCRCECGNQKVVMAQSLNRGVTQSCGCLHREISANDLSGQQFGRLKVIRRSKRIAANGSYYWWCRCCCGTKKRIAGAHLVDGNTQSCGCIVRTHGLSQTKPYKAMKARERLERSRLLDTVWTFEMEQALRELQTCCVLCFSAEKLSVDHVQPLSLGHGLRPGNAVILCGSCNSKKSDKPLSAFSPEVESRLLRAARSFESHWAAIQEGVFAGAWD